MYIQNNSMFALSILNKVHFILRSVAAYRHIYFLVVSKVHCLSKLSNGSFSEET